MGNGQTKGDEYVPLVPQKPDGVGGKKTIGFYGGICLMLNNLTGPAMVTIPLVYQTAGWLTPTLALLLMTLLSTLASLFICESLACIPGNNHLQGRVEFSTLVNFFFGPKGHIAAQIFINASLQCLIIASVIVCAQVADDAAIFLFGRSCGVQLYPSPEWLCVTKHVPSNSPFPDESVMLFTVGLIFMMAIVVPMGYLNLDDNIIIQIVSIIFLGVVTIDWLVSFLGHGLTYENVPMVGKSQARVLGEIMSNFVFVTTVPSWIGEKKYQVSVHKTLWSSTIIATISYFILGFFGALSYTYSKNADILSVIAGSPHATMFDKTLVYLFPLLMLATSIPVFSIVVKYNLLQNSVCSKRVANFFAVVMPWIVVIPFMTGDGLDSIINWGTIVFASIANFVIPFVVYTRAIQFRNNPPDELTDRQKEILHKLNLKPVDLERSSMRGVSLLPFEAIKNFSYSKLLADITAIVLAVLIGITFVLNVKEAIDGDSDP